MLGYLILLLVVAWDADQTQGAIAGVPCWEPVCEFTFTLTLGHSMTMNHPGGLVEDLVLHPGGCLKPKGAGSKVPCMDIDANTAGSRLITADGRRKPVLLVNGQFPGPTLEVSEGSKIIIHVRNMLTSISTTIHWHGIHMLDSQWMDGPAYITQCPIPPGFTFSYRFKAIPGGTHWYHPHLTNLRQDGQYGLLVFYKSPPALVQLPLIVSDWYLDSGFGERVMNYRSGYFGTIPKPISSLVNGRGRYFGTEDAPLSQFKVKVGEKYRFRCVSAATHLKYEVSVDQHQMTVVAWDGVEIVPMQVDMFNIFPGERVDFEIVGRPGLDAAWIRVISLTKASRHDLTGHGGLGVDSSEEDMADSEGDEPGPSSGPSLDSSEHGGDAGEVDSKDGAARNHSSGVNRQKENGPTSGKLLPSDGYAILSYGPRKFPSTHFRKCTSHSKCRMFNCFRRYAEEAHISCVDIQDVHTVDTAELVPFLNETPTRDIFLNVVENIGDSVGGYRFVEPLSPFYGSQPFGLVSCEERCQYATDGCWCSHGLKLRHNELVNIVLMSYESPNHGDGVSYKGRKMGHPMHLHGYRFAVVAQGFSRYNRETGAIIGNNKGVKCDTDVCRSASWNPNFPIGKMDTNRPPLKDTILVPYGGYVVIRVRASNPGYWLFHCHVMRHQLFGMAMYVEVAPEMVNPPPPQLPPCSQEPAQYKSHLQDGSEDLFIDTQVPGLTSKIRLTTLEVVGIVIGSVAVGVLLVLLSVCLTRLCCGGSSKGKRLGKSKNEQNTHC